MSTTFLSGGRWRRAARSSDPPGADASRSDRAPRVGLLLGDLGGPVERLPVAEYRLRIQLEHVHLPQGSETGPRHAIEDVALDLGPLGPRPDESLDLGGASVRMGEDDAAQHAWDLFDGPL